MQTTVPESVATEPPSAVPASATTSIEQALARTLVYLQGEQQAGTHWAGRLSSSALATAIATVALRLVDAPRFHDAIVRGRQWLLATQLADGGWGDAVTDASNLNATSLALASLIFTQPEVGHAADECEALARARARMDALGGLEAVGDPHRCTLSGPCRTVAALAGLLDWQHIKHLRPEVILVPAPLRRTISTTFPAYLSIATLHSVKAPHPLNALPSYPRARETAMRWLQQTQGSNGSFEESAFLTSVIIACWTAAGFGDLSWLAPAVRFVVASQREDGGWPIDRDLETFDTDLTVFAFSETAGPVPNGAAVRDWLLARQFEDVCFPTGAIPGGWAWAMPAGWPDTDDTAYTVLALRKLDVPAYAPAIQRGVHWLEHMQNANGAWPTFVRNSHMPFDHDCPYITGHALSALQAAGRLRERPLILRRALRYLARVQRYDGSFASIWFREAIAGTASVLEALADCGLLHTPMAAAARDFLLRSQNDDGGWAGLRLQQQSTAEETAWALLALLRCPPDETITRAVRRGIRWLIAHQRADGTWAETPIGLYYSAMWYADSYYAITLPAQALARARSRDVD
jgi:squalene-hopene/tetraprenyl-beta-curcumene cyclase